MNLDEMRRLDATKTYKELEDAKSEIERLRKANFQLREGAEEQRQRIKRLEEAGDELAYNDEPDFDKLVRNWLKAKEAKP